MIIALGESLLVTGQAFAELDRTTATVAAFVVAFLDSAALWWLYFAGHARAALDRVARSDDPARLGRGGYAYSPRRDGRRRDRHRGGRRAGDRASDGPR